MSLMDFRDEFSIRMKRKYPNTFDWGLVGILTKQSQVYTLSYDSKILSGIFEIFCEPIVREIAQDFQLILEKTKQNAYPDFTLHDPRQPGKKIAVEVKSTYRSFNIDGSIKPFSYTLGSYRSYIRDGKKSILYPYEEYKEHWIVGFLYERNPECKETEIRQVIEASSLKSPFINIEYFVQEKYKIASKTQGSGNTTNIGSIKSNNISDFINGNGPFRSHDEFNKFWKEYG
ncbi:putative type-2 restriction enzyme EcoRV [Leptospira fainei serovar Hurstbridge str. BUT 6]|uniref:Type-2 restriction enzyme EcoRV n=1 Tax=Leptospira fainei serovar Hurstbridge str. BUT 6 TaxID=1193011 RepID=S3W012_9LEPT|nr:type II restriction endonuclease [Leptospira fainei]EPG73682.1 putative type-2 restriction enzyme EcoRV [Leptospira fainei serovar Hurstbridge str. BUT 6]